MELGPLPGDDLVAPQGHARTAQVLAFVDHARRHPDRPAEAVPGPSLGQAWMIPRKGQAEFQLGYKGVLNLAYRSPLIAAVRYGVVRKGDEFQWVDGRDWR